MAEEIQVRVSPAENLDETTVQRLVALINAAYSRHAWIFPDTRTDYERFREETAGSEILLLITRAEEIVGMAMIHPEAEALYFGLAAVDLTRQGQGYGAKLLQAIERLARQRGFSRLSLVTVEEIGNGDYYRRHGFRVTAEEIKPAGTWGSLASYKLSSMEKILD